MRDLNQTTLWTALVTPMTESGDVCYPSFEKLIRNQEAAGNGLLVLGSTGEALNLNRSTKEKIVDFAVSLNPNVPVMVGIGGHDLEGQVSWVNFLNSKKIDALLMVTPHYAKPGAMGQYEWFKTLMDTSQNPVMLYNVPGRSAAPLNLKTIELLKDHPRFWAIKEASGSVEDFKNYLKTSGKPVFCGDDGLMSAFANAGSSGLVSVASNPWPLETAQYVKTCLQRNFPHAALWERIGSSLFVASNPVPAKWLLKQKNVIQSDQVKCPLSKKDMNNTAEVLFCDEQAAKWYMENK